jgi:hypothetical protein
MRSVDPASAIVILTHVRAYRPSTPLTRLSHQSPIGVTSPFPLASLSAVTALRNSVLQPEVLDGYMTASALAGPHCQLRGMAPHAAKFVYDFWTHPTTMRNLCEAAGEDLIPVFELELGHTNVSNHPR